MAVILDENDATFKAAGFRHSLCQGNAQDLRFQSSSGAELNMKLPAGISQEINCLVKCPNPDQK